MTKGREERWGRKGVKEEEEDRKQKKEGRKVKE